MNTKENRDTIEIDLKRLLLIVWHRLWIIVLAAVLVGGMAVGYAWMFVTPQYASTAQFYVNNTYDSPGFSSSQIVAAQDLAYTYMVILKSRSVLFEVRDNISKEHGLRYSYDKLKEMVSTTAVNNTEVFQVKVTCSDYKHAAIIANAIVDVLPDKIAAVVEESSVRVVDRAIESRERVSPSYRQYLMIGALLGAVLTMVIVIIVDLLDTTVTSEEYLTNVYSTVPLLAVIPGTENPKTGYYKGYYESQQKQPAKKNGGGK